MKAREQKASVGIDIGGTFTDLVMVHPRTGERLIGKVLTTPDDPSRAVLQGLSHLLDRAGVPIASVGLIAHATTLATNTVITGTGARAGLVTTAGFRDTLEIQSESRYDLYDLELQIPPPLIPRALRREVQERLDHRGQVITALDAGEVRQLLGWFRERGIEDIAVCLIHAYANPEHERLVARIAQQMGGFRLSLSSEVCPEIREYPRVSTTVINAYIRPQIIAYLDRIEAGLHEMGFDGSLFIMSSAGGVLHPQTAKDMPAALVESGPAAGALAASYFARLTRRRQVLAFDMGGTTAKACLIEDARPVLGQEFEAARIKRFKRGSGYPIRMPVVELIEIGAGGGSIAWIDSMGLLKVGPEGAGSSPGPACYGLGGDRPTVTDADLVLGYLDPAYFLGGRMTLDRTLAEAAIHKHVARPLGLSVAKAALGILEVVSENMAGAARIHAIERGFDPRAFSLIAFGGAGPVHAYWVARRLGIDEVVFPVGAGVASAAGLLVSPASSHHVRTFIQPLATLEAARLLDVFGALEADGTASLKRLGITHCVVERRMEMRYVGQGHEVEIVVPVRRSGWLDAIRQAFEAQYIRLFGRLPGALPIEVINCRLSVSGQPQSIDLCPPVRGAPGRARKGRRMALFADGARPVRCAVYDRALLAPGERVAGPAIIEEAECTIVVPPGSSCRTDRYGNVIMARTLRAEAA